MVPPMDAQDARDHWDVAARRICSILEYRVYLESNTIVADNTMIPAKDVREAITAHFCHQFEIC
jgi:hypothetical protein